MGAPESFKDYKIGRMVQSTFGTAPNASDAVRHINCSPVSISPQANIREHNVADARRYLDEKDIAVDTKELMPELPVEGIVEKLELPFWLYLFFQNVSEAVGTPYGKTFTLASTQPDFASNAGYFASFLMQAPTASKDHLLKDCILKELTISCMPGERMKFNGVLVSRGAPTLDFNSSGTWTRNAGTFYHYSDIDVRTIDGSSITLIGGWTLKLTQDVTAYGTDGSGNFYSYVIDNRRAVFNATVLTETIAYTIESAYTAGTFVDLRLGYGNATPGTDDGDLDFAIHGYFSKATPTVGSPAGYDIELTMAGESGVTDPITAIIADAVDQTW